MKLEILEAARVFLHTSEERANFDALHRASIESNRNARIALEHLMTDVAGLNETVVIRFPELKTALICDWDEEENEFVSFREVKFFGGDDCND